jgi:hypothetical protein
LASLGIFLMGKSFIIDAYFKGKFKIGMMYILRENCARLGDKYSILYLKC